ncbi:response regulator, partial [Aliiglaciecola sp.]|nr:response regulator [Aliiglaciecola sp.]
NWHEPPFLLDEQSLMHSLQNQIWKQNEQQLTAEDDSLTTRLKVLVVEDNEINATVVVNMLRNMGHKAVVAVNGKEALTIHSSMVFDVILMDVQMPVMDGLEATRRIRETDQSIPIIGLSANVLPEDRKKASNAGMSGYLNKPVLMNELKKHLQQISLPN